MLITEYMKEIIKIEKPLVWEQVSSEVSNQAEESKDHDRNSQLTACFFGECGSGKSTDLSLISEIYSKKYRAGK